MKKRVVSLIISAFIVCSCILTVMASSGLDLNVLRKGEDIQYTESNRDDIAAYVLSSIAKNNNDVYYSEDGSIVSFTPIIFARKTSDSMTYCYDIKFTSNRFLNLKQVIFIIGNVNYIFSDIYTTLNYPYSTTSGKYEEEAIFSLDDVAIQMIADIAENRDNQGQPVEVILEGSDESFTLIMNDELTNGMIHLYNLFVNAGGTSESNQYLFPQFFFATWKYSKVQ